MSKLFTKPNQNVSQFKRAHTAILTHNTYPLNREWASLSPVRTQSPSPSPSPSDFRPISPTLTTPETQGLYKLAKESIIKKNTSNFNRLYKYPKQAFRKSRKNRKSRKANRKTRKNRR